MVKMSLLYSAICIYLIVLGSFLGAIGLFKTNNKELENRAGFWFFSKKYFQSLIEQKYFGIFGFISIGLGSLGQLILLFLNFENVYFEFYITIAVICAVIVFTLLIFWVLNKIIYLQEKRILIPHYLKEYNSIIGKDNYKDNPNYINTIKELSILLRISKTGIEEEYISYVVEKSDAFCKKRNINV